MAVKSVAFHLEFDVTDLVRLLLAEVGRTLDPVTEVANINVDEQGKGTLVVLPKAQVDAGEPQ